LGGSVLPISTVLILSTLSGNYDILRGDYMNAQRYLF
jgi:hypothetical protein